jgi:hypothetical protein
VLPDKLEGMVAAVIAAAPSLQREQAVHFLLHTARGRNVAQHLASITKTEREHPVPQVNIFKLHNPDSVKEIAKSIISGEVTGASFHDVLMGHARLSKRDGETDAKAFNRLYEGNVEFRKADRVATEAGWISNAKVNTMSVEVVSTEVGNTLTSDDSAKAYRQLQELAEKQHRTFEQVFSDPANGELAGRTYTSAHRPTVSSPSGDALQR